MKKNSIYSCNVCKKETVLPVNLTHYIPNKCNITLGCKGRLFLVKYTSENSISDGTWYSRFENKSNAAEQSNSYINLGTGTANQIVLCSPLDTDFLKINFELQNTSRAAYQQYTYRKNSTFLFVNGVEDGVSKKVLKFDLLQDEVKVLINGIAITQGDGEDQYKIYPINNVPQNTIIFNKTMPSGTQVDVLVYKTIEKEVFELTFIRNIIDESRTIYGAYEGCTEIIKNSTYFTYTCDIKDLNLPNKSAKVISIFKDQDELSLTDHFFVFGGNTVYDRVENAIVKLQNLSQYVCEFFNNGYSSISIDPNTITEIYPGIICNYDNTYKESSANTSYDSTIVIGPDT